MFKHIKLHHARIQEESTGKSRRLLVSLTKDLVHVNNLVNPCRSNNCYSPRRRPTSHLCTSWWGIYYEKCDWRHHLRLEENKRRKVVNIEEVWTYHGPDTWCTTTFGLPSFGSSNFHKSISNDTCCSPFFMPWTYIFSCCIRSHWISWIAKGSSMSDGCLPPDVRKKSCKVSRTLSPTLHKPLSMSRCVCVSEHIRMNSLI